MIARIAGGKARRALASPFLRDEHGRALEQVARSPVFTYVAKGNAHEARALRATFSDFVETVTGRKLQR